VPAAALPPNVVVVPALALASAPAFPPLTDVPPVAFGVPPLGAGVPFGSPASLEQASVGKSGESAKSKAKSRGVLTKRITRPTG